MQPELWLQYANRQPAADAMLRRLMTVGRLMRQRQPATTLDPGMFWLLKTISAHGPAADHRPGQLRPPGHLHRVPARRPAGAHRARSRERRTRPTDAPSWSASPTTARSCSTQAFQRRRELLESTPGRLGTRRHRRVRATPGQVRRPASTLEHHSGPRPDPCSDATRALIEPSRPRHPRPAGTRRPQRHAGAGPHAERRLPEPPADPGGDGRPDGRHVPGRARPEHRRRRSAPDHLRARRPGQAVLGRDRVPADLDRGHPAVGQDLRPARPPPGLPGRDRGLPDRLGHLRHGAEHRGDDPRPGHPGPRRRRSDVARPGGDRRHHPAARARQVPGLLRRRLRRLLGRRTAARRPVHRPPGLAVDLPDQPADRHRRPGGDLDRAQAARTSSGRRRWTTSARPPSSAR